MDSSLNVLPNLDHYNNPSFAQKWDTFSKKPTPSSSNELLDMTQINFSDDETWLSNCTRETDDLHKWLHSDQDDLVADLPKIRSETQKNIDSRTFTRPKKRYTRPSIEKYNEELYGDSSGGRTEDIGVNLNLDDQLLDFAASNLTFDLNQPVKSHYFDNIIANASLCESFTNMSPPSLVNSMCSSTFANLMENSFIKNDPALREIRDTDYTETILLQDTEPMFQSITGSCSSLNSDAPENYLKKITANDSIMKNSKKFEAKNAIFDRKDNHDVTQVVDEENYKENQVENGFNTTYQRKSRTKATFRVADVNNGTINSTFQRRKNESGSNNSNEAISREKDANFTFTHESDANQTNKRLLDRRPIDINRLSYLVDKQNDDLHATFGNKRNSFGSTDSTENLDYMSVSSASSKSSTKILSMDGLNHIVEMQEKSLQQVMSTPKPYSSKKRSFCVDTTISPISVRNSDPELSVSSEKVDYKTPPTIIGSSSITKQRSLGQINSATKTVASMSKFQQLSANIRGSYPSLKNLDQKLMKSSDVNLRKSVKNAQTNLNAMGRTLKGSYTSLKPTNTNLPVAPPLDDTYNVPEVVNANVTHARNTEQRDAQFLRPQPPKASGLPRPVSASTSIPRPVSRIPGPRSIRVIPKPGGRSTNY